MISNFPKNCYKVRLLLSLLGRQYRVVPVDLMAGEQKTAAFLQLNPFGQAPVLTDGDDAIRDSQAILIYLAEQYGRSDWWPKDAKSRGEISAWLSTAAKEMALGPGLTIAS
jgi:glutathione S-transferase